MLYFERVNDVTRESPINMSSLYQNVYDPILPEKSFFLGTRCEQSVKNVFTEILMHVYVFEGDVIWSLFAETLCNVSIAVAVFQNGLYRISWESIPELLAIWPLKFLLSYENAVCGFSELFADKQFQFVRWQKF